MQSSLFKAVLTALAGAGISAVASRFCDLESVSPVREPKHPVRKAAITTAEIVGIAAAGAGLMYMLDPAKGRSRRAWLVAKSLSRFRNAGKTAHRMGRHLRNRMRGRIHDVSEVTHHWLTGNGHRQRSASV